MYTNKFQVIKFFFIFSIVLGIFLFFEAEANAATIDISAGVVIGDSFVANGNITSQLQSRNGSNTSVVNRGISGNKLSDISARLSAQAINAYAGQNLVTNGDFISDISGWTNSMSPTGTLTWDSTGKMKLTNDSAGFNAWVYSSAITVLPNTTYEIYAHNYGNASLNTWVGTSGTVFDNSVLGSTNVVFMPTTFTTGAGVTTIYVGFQNSGGVAGQYSLIDSVSIRASAPPKYIVVQGGINDVVADVSADTMKTTMSGIISSILSEDITPVVLNVGPWGALTTSRQAVLDTYNTWLATYGPTNGARVVDINTLLKDPGTNNILPAYDRGDGVHPNTLGYQVIGDEIAQNLRTAPITILAANQTISYSVADCSSGDYDTGVIIKKGATNATILHYTFLGCNEGIFGAENFTIKNSIFQNNTTEMSWSTPSEETNWKTINGDPLFVSTIGPHLLPTSPAIDSGIGVGLTTDYSGNSIYGVPDIGAYEYQPPYTFSANDIPTTGSIRLYSVGQYRITTASSTAAVADFSVTPAEGSYYATTTQYMDINIDSWLTSDTYNKQWTATSTAGDFLTHATSTIYTIGDLLPNTYYTFKLDGTASTTAIVDNDQCTNGICLSDANGQIVFTYQGGYSTHTFALERDVIGPGGFYLLSPNNDASVSTRPTLSWNATSDSESGLAKYQLYINNTLNRDNISVSVTSITPQSDLTCGSYNWFVRAVDNAGNTTDSDTRNMALLCGSVSVSSPASPTTFQTYDPKTEKTTTETAPNQTSPDAEVPVDSDIPSTGIKEPNAESTWNQILSEGEMIATGDVNQILLQTGQTRDLTAESKYSQAIVGNIVQGTGTSEQTRNAITNFVTYGTQTTKAIGAGERAGVVNSFKSAFGKLPETKADWQDIIKIANGRWPGQTNTETEKNAEAAFRKIYLRNPNRTNSYDDAAIVVMAYGLRPANRNMESEKRAIGFFTAIYGYAPARATAWDVVRAIAYSGATR
jgi:lysophospholipase L1-like esterase